VCRCLLDRDINGFYSFEKHVFRVRVVLTESLESFGQFGIVSLDFAVGLRMTRSGVGMFDRVPFEIDLEFIGEKLASFR
jgi:hypothetical protein